MTETTQDTKWKIPYGIGYGKLTKIIRVLIQKNAQSNYVSVDSLVGVTSLAKNFLTSNLSFLESVNVLEGDNTKGYKFTQFGFQYAKAISLGHEGDITKYSLELITKSHLHDLKVLIDAEKETLTIDKLYKLIKTNARISDGDNAGDMPASSSTGTKTLLHILKKSGLIDDNILDAHTPKKNTVKNKTTSGDKIKKASPSTMPTQHKGDDFFTLNSDKFSISINKKIDLDELEYVKKQVDSLFELAKKKIESQ